jgi:hypothetical protein
VLEIECRDGEPEGRDRKFSVPWPEHIDATEIREWMVTGMLATGDPAKGPPPVRLACDKGLRKRPAALHFVGADLCVRPCL